MRLAILAIAATICGCAQDENDLDFRTAGDPWSSPAGVPGNGDLTIFEGPVADIEGGILWDIQGSTVHSGGRDPNGPVAMQVYETEIFDATGALLCWVELNGPHARLYDVDGSLVATEHGRFVEVNDEVVISLHHEQVFAGEDSDDPALGTATEVLHNANKMRTLVYGALFLGECGSNGP